MGEMIDVEGDIEIIRAAVGLERITWPNIFLAQRIVSQSLTPGFLADMHDCWNLALTIDEAGLVTSLCGRKQEQLDLTTLQGEKIPDLDADVKGKLWKQNESVERLEWSWNRELRKRGQEENKTRADA